jgi:hypothetical protein
MAMPWKGEILKVARLGSDLRHQQEWYNIHTYTHNPAIDDHATEETDTPVNQTVIKH